MLVLGILFAVLGVAAPHGRLIEPPARSCMWRYGFRTPRNYDDNALFCGGLEKQWSVNKGKCGVCGDPYDERPPRSNEAGGKYATGTIAGYYRQGQEMSVRVEVTANHGGYFEFRLCPLHWRMQDATQDCLDRNKLRLTNNMSRFVIPSFTTSTNYTISLHLPDEVMCERCVLQWKWVTANSWGCDNPPHDCCIGCGSQETFVNCADINIQPAGAQSVFASSTKHNQPTAHAADKPTVLVMDNGEEVVLDTVPPAGMQKRRESWEDVSVGIHAPVAPKRSNAGDRTITPVNSAPADTTPVQEEVRVYSASSSSFPVEPVLANSSKVLPDPHIGQDYNSSKSYSSQTKHRSSTTTQTGQSSGSYSGVSSTSSIAPSSPTQQDSTHSQTAAAKTAEPAPSVGIAAGVPGASVLSIDVLQSLAAIMRNAKPVSCQPKYHVDGFNVDCDRLCVPSGIQCNARQRSEIINAACKIMCKITA